MQTKHIKRLVVCTLFMAALSVYAQNDKRDSLRREVNELIQRTQRAAEVFLNRQLSEAERLKAITPYTALYEERQKEQFKGVVLSNEETPAIRAAALGRIRENVGGDQALFNQAVEWIGNPRTPKVLRETALGVAGDLAFNSMQVLEVYQKMLDDPEEPFRLFAYRQLVVHGDARAQQKLIRGLETPAEANLPAHTAIELLTMSPKTEHYPTVYKVMQETKDEATRIAAIRSLGPYREARAQLIQISRSADEKEPFREAALGALYVGDRNNIVTYASPILTDKSASERLQAIAIQMSIDVRQAMAYRVKAKKADAYDVLVKDIAEGKGVIRSAALEKVAGTYLQRVNPKY